MPFVKNELTCDSCGKYVGEVSSGRIMKGLACYCPDCNKSKQLLLDTLFTNAETKSSSYGDAKYKADYDSFVNQILGNFRKGAH